MVSPRDDERSTSTAEQFSLQASGRSYPPNALRIMVEEPELPPDDLSFQLQRAIRARWKTKNRAGDYTKYRDLVTDYLHDVNLLRDAVHEVREAVVAAWRLNTQFFSQTEVNAQARDQFVRKHADRLSVIIDRHLTAPPASLSAELEAMPLEFAFLKLRDSLDEALTTFARDVCAMLDAMTEQGMVGIIKWATPTACDLHYFKDIIIQQEHESQTVRSAEQVIGIRQLSFGYAEKLRQEVFQVTKGEHIMRRGRYDLYLTEAKSSDLAENSVVVPRDIASYMKSLPAWLQTIGSVVHGTELKKRLVAMDVDLEHWEDTQLVEVVVRERACGCPVIAWGHYVLTGWGDEEETREVARRWSGGLLAVAGLLQTLAVMLFCLGQLAHHGFGVVAAVTAGLGLLGFVESRRQAALSKEENPSVVRLAYGGMLWGLFSVGSMAMAGGIVASRPPLMGIGLGGLLLLLGLLLLGVGGKAPDQTTTTASLTTSQNAQQRVTDG